MTGIVTPVGHGPRLYVLGARVHHGLAGMLMLVAGAVLVATDWHDRPWHLIDSPNPTATAGKRG